MQGSTEPSRDNFSFRILGRCQGDCEVCLPPELTGAELPAAAESCDDRQPEPAAIVVRDKLAGIDTKYCAFCYSQLRHDNKKFNFPRLRELRREAGWKV